MDLGCLDLGCIEKQVSQSSVDDSDISPNDSLRTNSKSSKNKALKETNWSSPRALNRLTTQIKKPTRRKTSPLGWFPRKKVDSYLKRKIKLIQEVGGMNSSLDETLGDSNPHYSKVLREKIAVREAAYKAMEARKAALVEASWCRILQAARIESKDAQALLENAEKTAAEAFESAKEIGVTMYDIPDCPRKHYKIETSAVNGGESTTHKVTTSFETAFEVDKQVAAAVKAAFVRLSSCPSISKDEFKELLRKISQNPDLDEHNQDLSGLSSECESDAESGSHKEDLLTNNLSKKKELSKEKQRENLVELMLQRLGCLQEEELASLATIVATCGLNAALAEAENTLSTSTVNGPSSFGEGRIRNSGMDGCTNRKQQVDTQLPSLDKFLVKRLTRLEREVQDAKNARKNKGIDGEKVCTGTDVNPSDEGTGLESVLVKHYSKLEKAVEDAKPKQEENNHKGSDFAVAVPDFQNILTKHTSKLQKDIEESKRNCGNSYEPKGKRTERLKQEVPSLDKYLVKHVSRLEREVQEAKKQKENVDVNKERDKGMAMKGNKTNPSLPKQNSVGSSNHSLTSTEKLTTEATEASSLIDENKHTRKEPDNGLDKFLVKPVHRLEREKKEALSSGSSYRSVQRKSKYEGESDVESLDKVLVKHVSRLEKEKMELGGSLKEEAPLKVKRDNIKSELEAGEGSLDQILVKHKSRLEREKVAAAAVAAEEQENQIKNPLAAKREARERELQEAWGGMSFGNSIRPHLSRLQRDKAAWLKAEEEERRRATEEPKVV